MRHHDMRHSVPGISLTRHWRLRFHAAKVDAGSVLRVLPEDTALSDIEGFLAQASVRSLPPLLPRH